MINSQLISGDKLCAIFDEIYSDILQLPCDQASLYMQELWSRYDNVSQSLNGKVFAALLAVTLYRFNILPIFAQAKLAFVPNVDFDFILYSQEFGPVVLSAKTSLRERYKQADLEGMMLRQVHRKAKTYLLTLDAIAAKSVNKKIASGQVLGIDEVITATSSAFDDLLAKLQKLNYYKPTSIEIIAGQRLIEGSKTCL